MRKTLAQERPPAAGRARCARAVAGTPQDSKCSQGGDCDPELSDDCQPPDYHCSKCGRYMGAA